MLESGEVLIRFWGVRGSIARPGPETVRYGGNTACVEVRCGENLLIFDGGTGLYDFGRDLMKQGGSLDADLFYTHTHFDHINGLPFFAPCHARTSRIRLWAGHLLPENHLKELLTGVWVAPFFPVPLDIFSAQLKFKDFHCGETLSPRPGISIRTAPLNHPNRATGYRIEYGGRVVAYITDTEHQAGRPDQNVLSLIDHADVMIYDATYTEEELPLHVGWGHSTWQEGIKLAGAAAVNTLVLFHHAPEHDDAFMDRVANLAHEARPGTLVAKEGLMLRP
jgi:phosphoribosyl 1,2-cyclic phosphodiesterase